MSNTLSFYTDLLISLQWFQLKSGEELSDLLKKFPIRIGMIIVLYKGKQKEMRFTAQTAIAGLAPTTNQVPVELY